MWQVKQVGELNYVEPTRGWLHALAIAALWVFSGEVAPEQIKIEYSKA
mgnify:CR=1 FL=1